MLPTQLLVMPTEHFLLLIVLEVQLLPVLMLIVLSFTLTQLFLPLIVLVVQLLPVHMLIVLLFMPILHSLWQIHQVM